MRKVISSLFLLLFAATTMMAQEGAAAIKAAKKAFAKYQISQDLEAVVDAAQLVDKGFMSSEVKSDPKLLNTAGPIFAGYYAHYLSTRKSEEEKPVIDQAMSKAVDAHMMAFNKSEKKGDKKAALKGLSLLQSNLSNEGKVAYQAKEYGKAKDAFIKGIELHEFLEANGGTSLLVGKLLNDEMYFAGLTALLSKDNATAKKYLEALYQEDGYADASVYDALSKLAMEEKDMEAAAKYIEEGRKAFPEDQGLLFGQINLYMQQDKLDVLMSSLDEGIAAAPDNPSLYLVKAQAQEKLYTQSVEAGTPDEAAFDGAIATLEAGLEKIPGDARLIYNIGLLQFNRGAALSQKLQALSDDFSKEGQRKYDALLAKVDAQFDKALPFFKKAEMANPNDPSILQALRAIYARKDQIEVSNEFKARLEKVDSGGTNDTSYFKEKGM